MSSSSRFSILLLGLCSFFGGVTLFAAPKIPENHPFTYTQHRRDPFISPNAIATEVNKATKSMNKTLVSPEEIKRSVVQKISQLLLANVKIGGISAGATGGFAIINGQIVETGGAFKLSLDRESVSSLQNLIHDAFLNGVRYNLLTPDEETIVFDVQSIQNNVVSLTIPGSGSVFPLKYEKTVSLKKAPKVDIKPTPTPLPTPGPDLQPEDALPTLILPNSSQHTPPVPLPSLEANGKTPNPNGI